jgi:hypothetical protein
VTWFLCLWNLAWIIGGIVVHLRRIRVPRALLLTPEEDAARVADIMSRVEVDLTPTRPLR